MARKTWTTPHSITHLLSLCSRCAQSSSAWPLQDTASSCAWSERRLEHHSQARPQTFDDCAIRCIKVLAIAVVSTHPQQ
ncbi:uncharacterized protein K489DRAFT_139598 [Dissoconium aciculare CBS 342.82]|uniref:Secreted protein n=1 Tax=Dissoconium aciculare CBS 342.82 TaxID=1314786 RepID=A0A6J3LRB9_9PEZI|nr:uncharacterized protein K489DRAFT_139598 [Dissoconium aciculare CBS 342.82]KAF1817819.1 hypothetical protein K489DRAFT_139598 [Dissoconium aciculare CBS 342.82]